MTIKRAIAIGTLSAITITLIAFGIKTKSFKPKTTTPTWQHRSAIRVDAEDLYPVSKKWLFKNQWLNSSTLVAQTTINYTTYKPNKSEKSNETTFKASSVYGIGLMIGYSSNSNAYPYYWTPSGSIQDRVYSRFNFNQQRIVNFETNPTGDLYTFLNNNADPAYNSDILLITGHVERSGNTANTIYENTGINEIRKDNLPINIEDVNNGRFISSTGTIQLFLDAGISSLNINGTEYINSGTSTVNITNDDIVIRTQGTNSGNTSSVFTINYFNTRPPIEPQPYPDPGEQVVEVIEIMPMMFKILTMPFTFISQAFNVTLWEGTPYQFNFSNFILSLIAIATLLFIIKLFTSGFSIIGNYSANHESRALKRSQTKLNNAKTQQIKNGTKDKPSKKG